MWGIGQGHPDGLVGDIERGIGGFAKLPSLIDRETGPIANIPDNNYNSHGILDYLSCSS